MSSDAHADAPKPVLLRRPLETCGHTVHGAHAGRVCSIQAQQTLGRPSTDLDGRERSSGAARDVDARGPGKAAGPAERSAAVKTGQRLRRSGRSRWLTEKRTRILKMTGSLSAVKSALVRRFANGMEEGHSREGADGAAAAWPNSTP